MSGNGLAERWDAVLFDLDGTLADTVELILRCYRHTMLVHRGETIPDERWLATIGTPLREQLAAFATGPDEVALMAETYVAHQLEIHDRMVTPFPGAVELVGTLRASGVRIGVVTSKRRGMAVRTLERCGLGGAYDVLIGADDVARPKPDPEPVRAARAHLGLDGDDPGRTLFVGDSPFDLRAGRGAGARTGAALWGPYARSSLEPEAPDYWLDALGDVLTL
ncbi:MAG TPA: HAD-IA family hydrolase [Longimicrobiales bacterium]|nr:HAD-IA family hydrolase [Longimicrobiales bacterium]